MEKLIEKDGMIIKLDTDYDRHVFSLGIKNYQMKEFKWSTEDCVFLWHRIDDDKLRFGEGNLSPEEVVYYLFINLEHQTPEIKTLNTEDAKEFVRISWNNITNKDEITFYNTHVLIDVSQFK